MKKSIVFCWMIILSFVSFTEAQNNLPYLGQTPPGLIPKRFPPASLLSNGVWQWHGSPMFSSDGREMFWVRYDEPGPGTYELKILTMKVENNNWSAVHSPSFANPNYKENNPLLKTSGDTMFYYSDRQTTFINMVTRNSENWNAPQPLNIPLPGNLKYGNTFSINKNFDIYVDLYDTITLKSNIYISRYINGNYQLPEALGPEINSASDEMEPFIDPDEEYLIFGSNRPGGFNQYCDLYISFKEDNNWTNAINMGHEINGTMAYFPIISLDKKYLFFVTGKSNDMGLNPYWVSSDIIDSLHVLININDMGECMNDILFQNKPNPAINGTTISFQLKTKQAISLNIYSLDGKLVRKVIINKTFQKGKHSVDFDISDLPSGNYLYTLYLKNGKTITKKMLVSR